MDKEDPEHYDTEKAIAYLEKAVENQREMSMQRTVWGVFIWMRQCRKAAICRKVSVFGKGSIAT